MKRLGWLGVVVVLVAMLNVMARADNKPIISNVEPGYTLHSNGYWPDAYVDAICYWDVQFVANPFQGSSWCQHGLKLVFKNGTTVVKTVNCSFDNAGDTQTNPCLWNNPGSTVKPCVDNSIASTGYGLDINNAIINNRPTTWTSVDMYVHTHVQATAVWASPLTSSVDTSDDFVGNLLN